MKSSTTYYSKGICSVLKLKFWDNPPECLPPAVLCQQMLWWVESGHCAWDIWAGTEGTSRSPSDSSSGDREGHSRWRKKKPHSGEESRRQTLEVLHCHIKDHGLYLKCRARQWRLYIIEVTGADVILEGLLLLKSRKRSGRQKWK